MNKTIIENYLNTLSSLPIIRQNNSLTARISSLKKKLTNKTFLQLVILGQFKRGKTSLINALFGKELLPTAIIPLTSIVTILKYGDTEKITVIFLDGTKKSIEHSQLPEYITESQNPKNEKGVDKVIFEYPADLLKDAVEIIDTPGVGSVYKHNTDIAYQFVPKADAGIFVVTADPPISESELRFLKSVKDYLGKIIFVQNKIDLVNKEDQDQSLLFTKKIISEAVGKEKLNFYQLSAKLGFEGKREKNRLKLNKSKLNVFENNLKRLVFNRKEQILLTSLVSKLLPLISEIELLLQVEKKALQMSVDELYTKAKSFTKEAQKLKQEREDDNYIITGQADKLTKEVLINDIENLLKERELPKLLEKFEDFFQKNRKLNGKKLTQEFEFFLETSIKKIFNDWRKEEEKKLQKTLESIISRFNRKTNQYIQKVIDLSASLFSLKLTKFQVDTSLAEEIEFRFSFDEFKTDLEVFTPFVVRLPRFISHKLLYSKMKADILNEFDRHCGRVRYDFHERINKSISEYKDRLDEVLEQTIIGIETAISKILSAKENKEEHQQKKLEEIDLQENVLVSIRRELDKYILEKIDNSHSHYL